MKRRWNAFVWAGFAVALLAFLSYFLFFYRFPATRDLPWANFLLFLTAGWLLWVGLRRAFREPEHYRGKLSGSVLSVLSLAVFVVFCLIIFHFSRQLPASVQALRAGQRAPDLTLFDTNGTPVTLSGLLKQNRAVVLIFYRGYW